MGLILDTSIFIAAERHRIPLARVISRLDPSEELGISVVTIAELQHGVRRAKEPWQLARRQALFNDAVAICEVYDLTSQIALRIGDLDAELSMRGEKVAFPDLAIAATTLTLDFTLVTGDKRHFPRFEGLRLIHPV
jgi:predicted nucleic acid-binding protein